MGPSTRSMRRIIAMVVAIALAGLAAAGALAAFRRSPGPQGDGTSITPYGMKVTPASTSEKLGERPYGMALSPDGDHVLIANAGVYRQSVMLVDASTGLPSQEIVYPSPQTVSWGVAWSPGGNRAYASDPANDRIHVFKLGDGRLHKRPSLELSKKDSWPTGVAVAPDGGKLYIAEMVGNALSVIDTSTGEQSRVPLTGKTCPALAKGVDPSQGRRCNYSYTVALSHDGRWAYVSNWGKKTVSVVNTRREELVKTIRVGTHPSAMVLNPANDELYVANTDSDSISVIDTATNSATRSFSLRPYPGAQVGANPNALTVAPDGDTLYVANAGDNDIAVVDLAGEDQLADEVEGLIPTGWYPTGVALSPSGRRIYVSNAKGLGAGPNPNGPVPTKNPSTTPNQYIGAMIKGTLSRIPVPDADQLATYTERVRKNNRFDKERKDTAKVLENIKHVIYVINENRTYDQVLGDLKRGNGDPSLTLFGPKVTPNHHKLARKFTTLDNLYAAGEVSHDGWEWSTAATANTFNQKTWPTLYGGRGFIYSAEGGSLAAAPGRNPKDSYIWDELDNNEISYRNYGLWATSEPPVEVFNEPNLAARTDPQYPGYNLAIKDQYRFRQWVREFHRYEKRGKLPTVQFLKFPNDHTCGTDPACPTPQAMVADSDWATGKLVDEVSHSQFWKDTAIFIIEDDAQDGPDHVDAHRTIGHVVSPYTQTGEVDSTFYSSVSMLKTMEMILGLSPLTQFDAAATPMLNSFTSEPNFAPYKSVKPDQPLDEMNSKNAPMAKTSSKLDLSREDIAPWHILNRAIWKGVRGGDSKMPAPRHNLSIEEEEEEEE